MHAQEIKTLIETNLPDSTAILSGEDGRHFDAIVISSKFADKNRIQRQQLVYATLGERIVNGTIHAISMKTFTPDEWQTYSKEL